MQFIANGPDVPDALLQSHEDGRVVFFCGAGISFPAGLPSFSGLVHELYATFAQTPSAVQYAALRTKQFDTAIGLLEDDIVGGRDKIRRAVAEILTPKSVLSPSSLKTHQALLALCKTRDGLSRLITTNFDRLFEDAIQKTSTQIERFHAPLLPIPKNNWDGLVYLHGLLPSSINASGSKLSHLVLSSGDFGLAYLVERWAARFISELFRNFTVCFVGYSITDPILRYMMDALAADAPNRNFLLKPFAFGSYSKGNEKICAAEWNAKKVIPILYREHKRHYYLHETLRKWAKIYKDGILGKESIVIAQGLARPSGSAEQDGFVGRMLWALSDKSGLPALSFSKLDPVPSLEWLDIFDKKYFQHADLIRFGVIPNNKVDDKLQFSLFQRPTPYDKAPWMAPVFSGLQESNWDEVMSNLSRWLVRHLANPKLLLWVVERGGQLHTRLLRNIEFEINRIEERECSGRPEKQESIRDNESQNIPSKNMRKLWLLFLTGRVKTSNHNLGVYRWKDRFSHFGLNALMRLELRELLAPKIAINKPFYWGELNDAAEADSQKTISQLVDWELALTDNDALMLLDMGKSALWTDALPLLLGDFQILLIDALRLLHEMSESTELQSDRSFWDMPSISPHPQNKRYRVWVVLIELLRDAWVTVHGKDPVHAAEIAITWFELPYATFKRLALYAASQNVLIANSQWVSWLRADDTRWLWSIETLRETMRLLVLRGGRLSGQPQSLLEDSILAGMPQTMMFNKDITPEDIESMKDHAIWLRLAKLRLGGCALSQMASLRLQELSAKYPMWALDEKYEKDEFSFWLGGTGDPDFEESRIIKTAPRKNAGESLRKALVQWLEQTPSDENRGYFYKDDWGRVCRKNPLNVVYAILDLTEAKTYLTRRWSDAFNVWAEGADSWKRSTWRYLAPVLRKVASEMPDTELEQMAHAFTRWLKTLAAVIDEHEVIFFELCQRMLELRYADSASISTANAVAHAINHPVGHITEALLTLWFGRKPLDCERLPLDIEPFFTQLCVIDKEKFRPGRVLLASRMIALFRVDQDWTKTRLLPLLNWEKNDNEASAIWQGFLWSPRPYVPLFVEIKSQFLETAKHYGMIGEHGPQYCAILTYAALNSIDSYTKEDFRQAITALPQEGLNEVGMALYRSLESIGPREEYWKNRIMPFWHQIWPKSRIYLSQSISESLSLLCIAARGQFSMALDLVNDWLNPVDHPGRIILRLYESGLCENFPAEALELLNAVLGDARWPYDRLAACLEIIGKKKPDLRDDPRYQRLSQSK